MSFAISAPRRESLAEQLGAWLANVLTNKGKEIMVSRVGGIGSFGIPSYVGWGTGVATALASDTTLTTAATEARVNGTVSIVTTTQTNDTMQVIGTITADAGKTITNVGLFDGAGSGSPPTGAQLFVKADFTGIPLSLNDSIQFTIKVQQT